MLPTHCSRRALLGAALLSPGAALRAAGLRPAPGSQRGEAARETSVAALARRYRRELFEEVLPFWERHGIDHERGGFVCALDYDGTPVDATKMLLFQGRGIWVYSRLCNAFGPKRAWLEVASKAVHFVRTHMRQPDGSWAQRATAAGAILEGPDAGDTSALLYLAEGLQEYAAAARDAESAELARALLIDVFNQGRAASSPVRRQGLWFLTVLVATQVLARRPDPVLEEIARFSADAIIHRHHNPETGLNDEIVGADLSRSAEDAGFTVFGHSIEGLWMVMDDARRRGDQDVMHLCEERIRRHIDVGWDRVHDGLTHAIRVGGGGYAWPVERPVGTNLEFRYAGEYHYMKTFWSLAEVMVASLKVLERGRAPWAVEAFVRAQAVLDDRMSLRPRGFPVYALFTDRTMVPAEHASRQENYHHPRLLITAIEALGRMRAAGRRTL